jgi:O-acetyl-ADP-ribose deacetylase (regulator of RNase III)
MRRPGSVVGTLNAYLAMRAALVAALTHGRALRSLAAPGLCTGVGGMPPAEAAAQMRAAYDSVVAGRWRDVISPVMAPYALRRAKA